METNLPVLDELSIVIVSRFGLEAYYTSGFSSVFFVTGLGYFNYQEILGSTFQKMNWDLSVVPFLSILVFLALSRGTNCVDKIMRRIASLLIGAGGIAAKYSFIICKKWILTTGIKSILYPKLGRSLAVKIHRYVQIQAWLIEFPSKMTNIKKNFRKSLGQPRFVTKGTLV